MNYQLTVIVPTFNEEGNVIPLYRELLKSLKNIKFEVLFVDDDSNDKTLEEITKLTQTYKNVRYIRRIDRRGLSSACIEGFASSNSNYLAVIDADLQHDPVSLKNMLAKIKAENLDIVVASRFRAGASVAGLSVARQELSKFGNLISSIVTGANLTDPLSGYFIITKQMINTLIHNLSGRGFKILLDIFSTARQLKIKLKYEEVNTNFRERLHGYSKLDILTLLEFLNLLLDKLIGRFIPVRFVLFTLVGSFGLALHMVILWIAMRLFGIEFTVSQTLATILVMTSNFFMNNIFTFRDRRLSGLKIIKGLLSFYAACSIGGLFNVLVATFLYERGIIWFIAGFLGCVVGSIWNYAISSFFTWRK